MKESADWSTASKATGGNTKLSSGIHSIRSLRSRYCTVGYLFELATDNYEMTTDK